MLLRANELNPYDPDTLRSLMEIEGVLGKLDDSGARIEAAVAARPDSSDLLSLKGAYAMKSGDLKTAEQTLKRATELDRDNLAAYQQLAALYRAAGHLDEAIETSERGLERQPDSAQLHHFLALLYEMRGEVDRAIEHYEKAIARDENLAEPKNNLAYLLAESGSDLDRALDLAQEAKAMMPGSPAAADTLGWVLYKRGVASAAVGYLKEAVAAMDASSAELGIVRHHLAQAYEAADQPELAIETLELALAELEEQQRQIRARGGTPQEPEWAGPARAMFLRLEPAS
jgi:tetratricopeptide (TPR) repeat protein